MHFLVKDGVVTSNILNVCYKRLTAKCYSRYVITFVTCIPHVASLEVPSSLITAKLQHFHMTCKWTLGTRF